MALETVVVDGRALVVDTDGPAAPVRHTTGILRARLVDEMTGTPPDSAARAGTAAPGYTPRAALGGLAGLTGIPAHVYPGLSPTVTFGADGYLPVDRIVSLDPQPDFPAAFRLVDLGNIGLHRLPIVLAGRVVLAANGAMTPVGGANVTVSGIWFTVPPAHAIVPPSPPNLISLRTPLYADRSAAGATLARRDATPIAGQDKTLLAGVAAGDTRLRLSDRVGVAPGSLLAVEPRQPDRTEYVTVLDVAGASTPDQPASVTVDFPLTIAHFSGTTVSVIALGAAGPANALQRDAIPGDTCLFLTGMAGLSAAAVVEIAGGGPPTAEFHNAAVFAFTTAADGYYRLPLLSRVAQLNLRADDGAHAAVEITAQPDYTAFENRFDIVLR